MFVLDIVPVDKIIMARWYFFWNNSQDCLWHNSCLPKCSCCCFCSITSLASEDWLGNHTLTNMHITRVYIQQARILVVPILKDHCTRMQEFHSNTINECHCFHHLTSDILFDTD